ncbi:hypothetical protein [Salipaludibacillus daqingensis]|uniref:hypothetical protein n=1 Tax=Salipaludibacillus daqingensis TaxID=3041001 RepID=UPI002477069E|nr:hypothetical protein [Salipaludibacillus daqingensis]
MTSRYKVNHDIEKLHDLAEESTGGIFAFPIKLKKQRQEADKEMQNIIKAYKVKK